MNRDPATLVALIAIKPDYPARAPVFCLNLHWKGEHNQANSEHLRQLERLVNQDFAQIPSVKEEGGKKRRKVHWSSFTLSFQLRRLLSSLDVLLEAWNTEEAGGGKVDFPREKVFMQAVR